MVVVVLKQYRQALHHFCLFTKLLMRMVTGIISPPDPHSLTLRCLVNGQSVQSSNTNQMIFKTEALVSWVSK